MRKLSKQELDAVSAKITDALREEAIKAQKELDELSKEESEERARKVIKELENLSPDTKEYLDTERYTRLEDKMKISKIAPTFTPRQKVVTVPLRPDIFNALVIEQMESNSVQELIDAVTKQFKTPQ